MLTHRRGMPLKNASEHVANVARRQFICMQAHNFNKYINQRMKFY